MTARESMGDIARRIARETGVSVEDMRGPSRLAPIVRARQRAIAETRATGRYSTTKIGDWFGGRDHTTVIEACRRHVQRERIAALAPPPAPTPPTPIQGRKLVAGSTDWGGPKEWRW